MFNVQCLMSEGHLHLSLHPVVVLTADILATQATGVLQLHTALFVEPVLQTDGEISLIPSLYLGVTIIGLATSHDIEGINHRYAGCNITTAATHLSILSA